MSATFVVLAVGGVWMAWRQARRSRRCGCSACCSLPWLSASLPAALLIWSGPSVAARVARRRTGAGRPRLRRHWQRSSRVAALASAASRRLRGRGRSRARSYAAAAWQASPSVPSGDEPHYLIITQSLLKDHDLRIENNHRNGDYRAYYAGELPKPDYPPSRTRPADLLDSRAWPAGHRRAGICHRRLSRRRRLSDSDRLGRQRAGVASDVAVTGRADAAWFGWAAVTLSVSVIFHSFTVYPDGPGGVIALTGVWALLRAGAGTDVTARAARPMVAAWRRAGGAAVDPHAICADCRQPRRAHHPRLSTTRNAAGKAVAFLTIPAHQCHLLDRILHRDLRHARSVGAVRERRGLGVVHSRRSGRTVFRSAFWICWPTRPCCWSRLPACRRDGDATGDCGGSDLELLFVLVPYLLAVTHFAMWWGGRSAPATVLRADASACSRFPPASAGRGFGIARRARPCSPRWPLTAFISAALVFVDDGRLAFNVRETYARVARVAEQRDGSGARLPAWWRGPRAAPVSRRRDLAVSFFGAGVGCCERSRAGSWLRSRGALAAATASPYAAAAMVALTIVWALAGVDGRNLTPAQLEVLRRLGSERHALTFTASRQFHRLVACPKCRRSSAWSPGLHGARRRGPERSTAVPDRGGSCGAYRLRPRGACDDGLADDRHRPRSVFAD